MQKPWDIYLKIEAKVSVLKVYCAERFLKMTCGTDLVVGYSHRTGPHDIEAHRQGSYMLSFNVLCICGTPVPFFSSGTSDRLGPKMEPTWGIFQGIVYYLSQACWLMTSSATFASHAAVVGILGACQVRSPESGRESEDRVTPERSVS